MIDQLLESNIAVIGGGQFCKKLLELLFSDDFKDQRPNVLGVSDVNSQAPGMEYAKQLNIPTMSDYRELYHIEELQVLLELTADIGLGSIISKEKPSDVILIDHIEARSIWSSLQVEKEKRKALKELHGSTHKAQKIDNLFADFADRMGTVIKERSDRYVEIEREQIESERTLAQIIEGSTIPTFVIDHDHIVTHWNKAMVGLTGTPAATMVGTRRPSTPFWGTERPTMADVILDQISEEEIQKLYGEKWRKSTLIEGAYEAEVFFPRLGESGKWCWFTAAPIKAPDGTIVGAIETLWDKTEDKKSEEERERHTKELSILCSIYSALNAPADLNSRIDQVVQELLNFFETDSICVYLMDQKGGFYLKHSQGLSEEACKQVEMVDANSIIHYVAQRNEFTIFDEVPEGCLDEICYYDEERLETLAYIPISSKEKRAFGVIRIGCREPSRFDQEQKNVLELIGNRIGVAIENARLQEQYIKSEEKYRILFNSDPHPIFILDSQTFEILDTNQRAQDDYGYTREELLGLGFLELGDKNDSELIQGLKNLRENQSTLFTKKKHFRKGNQAFFVNINMSFAKYGDSDIIIASTTDISESVEKDTQLIQAGKMTTLGVMAAGMAHEINQPLNVIQVCADFFLKNAQSGPAD